MNFLKQSEEIQFDQKENDILTKKINKTKQKQNKKKKTNQKKKTNKQKTNPWPLCWLTGDFKRLSYNSIYLLSNIFKLKKFTFCSHRERDILVFLTNNEISNLDICKICFDLWSWLEITCSMSDSVCSFCKVCAVVRQQQISRTRRQVLLTWLSNKCIILILWQDFGFLHSTFTFLH